MGVPGVLDPQEPPFPFQQNNESTLFVVPFLYHKVVFLRLKRRGFKKFLKASLKGCIFFKGENPYLGHFQEYITFYGKMETN